MEKQSAQRRHWPIIAAILVIAVGFAVAGLLLHNARGRQSGPSDALSEVDENVLLYDGGRYMLNDNIQTVLIMGLDKYEAQIDTPEKVATNPQQADMVLLLIMDRANKVCTPLQFNRNTVCTMWWLDPQGEPVATYSGQLCLSHAFGTGGKDSCRNTVHAVSELLNGMEIDHYTAVTMDAVPVINDMVGGVTVMVQDDFSAYDSTLVQGETITLMGEQALHYVRGRMTVGDGTNVSRMRRQQQYMAELQKKFLACAQSDSNFTLRTMRAVSDYMVSDFTLGAMTDLANMLQEYTFTPIQEILGEEIEREGHPAEFYADEDALYQQVIDLFYIRLPDKEN